MLKKRIKIVNGKKYIVTEPLYSDKRKDEKRIMEKLGLKNRKQLRKRKAKLRKEMK